MCTRKILSFHIWLLLDLNEPKFFITDECQWTSTKIVTFYVQYMSLMMVNVWYFFIERPFNIYSPVSRLFLWWFLFVKIFLFGFSLLLGTVLCGYCSMGLKMFSFFFSSLLQIWMERDAIYAWAEALSHTEIFFLDLMHINLMHTQEPRTGCEINREI